MYGTTFGGETLSPSTPLTFDAVKLEASREAIKRRCERAMQLPTLSASGRSVLAEFSAGANAAFSGEPLRPTFGVMTYQGKVMSDFAALERQLSDACDRGMAWVATFT